MAHPDRTRALLAAALGCALLVAGPTRAAPPPAAPPASADPKVKFRDGERYIRDLSAALEIPRTEICKELSRYDCTDEAFLIVLGGVDPYEVRVLEPLDHASVGGPIAFDRVALNVCTSRVKRDVATPANAILFRAPPAVTGRNASPDKAWMEQTVQTIYDRLLRRDATADEKTRMIGFYQTLARGNRAAPADIAKDWVTLSCFSVASSLESVFY